MEINCELKPDDFLQFGKENARAKKNLQPMVIIFLITYLLFIFADVIYALFSGSLDNWNFNSLLITIVIRTIIIFVVIALVLAIVKLIAGKKVKDIVSKEPENGLFCEHKIILTEKNLIEITEVNNSRYSWKAIGEIKELESL